MKRFQVLKNSEDVYRVKINGQFMTDVDLMMMCSSNHISKILNFYSLSQACSAMAKYLERNERAVKINLMGNGTAPVLPPEPVIADTFEEI